MIDQAPLFTKTVHPYLLKLYIAIYQNCTLLFTEIGHYYLPIIVHCYLPITGIAVNIIISKNVDLLKINFKIFMLFTAT